MGAWFRWFSGFIKILVIVLGEPAVNPRNGVIHPYESPKIHGVSQFFFHPYKLELFINPWKVKCPIFTAIVAGLRGFQLPKKNRTQKAFQAVLRTGDFGPTFVRVWEFSLGDTKPGAGGASFEWTARGGEPGKRNRFCVGNPIPFLWFRILVGNVFGVRFFKVKCCDEITGVWGNKVTSEGVRCFYLKWFFEWRIFMKLGQLFVDLFGNRRQENICLQWVKSLWRCWVTQLFAMNMLRCYDVFLLGLVGLCY